MDTKPLQPLQLYVRRGDQVRGPLTVDQVKQLATTNRIRHDDQIGKTAAGPWQIASSVKGLAFPVPDLEFEPATVPVQPAPQVVYVQAPAQQPVQIINQVSAAAAASATAIAIGGRRGMSGIAAASIVLSLIGCVIAWTVQPHVGALFAVLALFLGVVGAVLGLFIGGVRDNVVAVILAVVAVAICAAAPEQKNQTQSSRIRPGEAERIGFV